MVRASRFEEPQNANYAQLRPACNVAFSPPRFLTRPTVLLQFHSSQYPQLFPTSQTLPILRRPQLLPVTGKRTFNSPLSPTPHRRALLPACSSRYLLTQRLDQRITARLCITKQHLVVRHIEHWIRDVSVAGPHAALHDDGLFGLPGVQDGHAFYG